jgi:hypothetical protein
MATDVGQLPPLPGDGCDVEQINDEELLRRMVSFAPLPYLSHLISFNLLISI